MMLRAGWRAAACVGWAAWAAGGCAGARPEPESPPTVVEVPAGAVTPAPATPPATAGATEPATDAAGEAPAEPTEESAGNALEAGGPEASAEARRTDWRATEEERQELLEKGPCDVEPPAGEITIDKTRRVLYQTVCGAVLWFDGLFGPQRNVDSARAVSGHVELALTESGYWGFDERTKFVIRAKIPNLEDRFHAYFGRDDDRDILYDRNEAFAIGSQFSSLERDERWVLGLGYGVPGSYAKRTDFRVGVKGGREPEIYIQGRLRRNWFVGERTLFHFRDTVFWTNREGVGNTASFDFDRVLTPRLLMRWSVVGTWGQETEGVDYRVHSIWYQNLSTSGRAIAYEVFATGETDDEVALEEYGLQAILRRPLGGRDWLYGELIVGYSFVRESLAAEREGSYLIGFGVELLFGQGNRYKP